MIGILQNYGDYKKLMEAVKLQLWCRGSKSDLNEYKESKWEFFRNGTADALLDSQHKTMFQTALSVLEPKISRLKAVVTR